MTNILRVVPEEAASPVKAEDFRADAQAKWVEARVVVGAAHAPMARAVTYMLATCAKNAKVGPRDVTRTIKDIEEAQARLAEAAVLLRDIDEMSRRVT